MDYIFASGTQQFIKSGLSSILISYDIACQWFKNLFQRFSPTEKWLDNLRVSSKVKYVPAIPKLHEPMHEGKNHQQYSLNYMIGVGLSDFEVPERFWAFHNALGNSTKTQGPGSRHVVLDDNFNAWNWWKYINMGYTLARKYQAAVAERNNQVEAHRGLTASLSKTVTSAWEKICKVWDNASYPKTVQNPYKSEEVGKLFLMSQNLINPDDVHHQRLRRPRFEETSPRKRKPWPRKKRFKRFIQQMQEPSWLLGWTLRTLSTLSARCSMCLHLTYSTTGDMSNGLQDQLPLDLHAQREDSQSNDINCVAESVPGSYFYRSTCRVFNNILPTSELVRPLRTPRPTNSGSLPIFLRPKHERKCAFLRLYTMRNVYEPHSVRTH